MTIIKASLAALLGVLAAAAALVVTHLAQLEALYRWAYVSAAWPAVGGVTLLHTPHALKGIIAGHPARAVQAVAWRAWTQRPVGQRWALLQAHTHAAAQMRLWLYIEVAVLTVLVASLAFRLLRGTWGPLWFVLGRVGRLQPGETHGKAAWADKRVARSLRPRRGAAPFVLGHAAGRRLIALPEALQYLNTLIVGRPGAGKSTLLIGNLLRERGTRSLVLTDPKSELWDTTSRHIGAHHRTLRLDFYDPSDQGAGYNPLAHITTPADALRFSQVWLANTREQDSEPPDSFWDATVALLLQAAILHLNHRHKAQGGATLPQLAAYLSTTDAKQMQEDLAGSPVPGARQAAQGFLRTIQGNERLAASVFVGLPLRFLALQDEAVQITTSHDSLGGDFSALGRREGRPVALYLVITRGREDVLRPLTAALLTQLFDELVRLANVSPKKALPRPVLAIVDEAGTIGQVGDLPGWLATLRSARVGVVLAFQALSQATRLYSAEGRELIEENCQTHLLFGGAGNASAGWMSAALGERTVVGEAASKTRDREHLFAGTGGRSKSKQEVGAPLMRAEEITELPPGTLIARIPHRRPLLVRVAPWYRSPRLRRRAGCWEQPPQPSVTQESGAAEAAATAPRA